MKTTKIGLFMAIILLSSMVLAANNNSTVAFKSLEQARQDLTELQARHIPTSRANESYQEALQLYSAQMALEKLNEDANFGLVIKYANDVGKIKKIAIKADDELGVFKEVFASANKSTNLSSMYDDYDTIILSFNQERFEDTSKLIDTGYNTLSRVQSSQTTLNLFYASTTQTIEIFFRTHWKIISAISGGIIFLLLVFRSAISKLGARRKLRNLAIQKETLGKLIKKLQTDYFIRKSISASSYRIRLKKFENMILDINRQIPMVRENIVKLGKIKEASLVNSSGKEKTEETKSVRKKRGRPKSK